jgi:hypothetical protein
VSPIHDYTISNASGSSVRNDIQNAVRALNSNNSNATAPTNQLTEGSAWADTSNHIFKRRDQSGNWISLRRDNGTVLIPDGSASSPGLTPSDDSNTGLFSPAADQIAIAANGSTRLTVTGSAITSTEPIGIPDGSASLPGITPSDDTNTGLFSSAADTLNFSTGGTERIKLDSNFLSRVDLDLDNRKALRLHESGTNSANYIALRAPSSLSSNVTLDFPATAGSSGECLSTNGSGTLSWTNEIEKATKLKTARTINGTSFDGSANISISAGKTLQVVETVGPTTGTQIYYNSSSWTTVISRTITLADTNNKALVQWAGGFAYGDEATARLAGRLVRTVSGSDTEIFYNEHVVKRDSVHGGQIKGFQSAYNKLDSPGTTSQITYAFQVKKTAGNNNTFYLKNNYHSLVCFEIEV